MVLNKLLAENRASILKRCFEPMVETSPVEVSTVLKEDDRFSNPVGFTISGGINALYDELLQDKMNPENVSVCLDSIIRIKAVQDCSPSQAVAFIFRLKAAIAEELRGEIEKKQVMGEWLGLEARIDRLAAEAFDVYTKCREKVYELRVSELKADRERVFRLLGSRAADNQEAWLPE